ncbi:MAG TPA: Ig-like domain-containing protein [Actinomycetota bacterium]|nr:Ig-like domain-containing protein [Actinomycetota bacterium]
MLTLRRRSRVGARAVVLLVIVVSAGLLPGLPTRGQETLQSEVWVTNQALDKIHVLTFEDVPAGEIDLAGQGDAPHLINFSPDGRYAYVASVNNGAVTSIRTSDRTIVGNITIPGNQGTSPPNTHQAAPTPDGTKLWAAHIANKTLYEIDVDTQTGALTMGTRSLTLPKSPICTVFSENGSKAYVSLAPDGIAVVDVGSFTQVGNEIATPGAVQCGMHRLPDGDVLVSSNGGAGSPEGVISRLDSSNDSLTELLRVQGSDVHGLTVSPDADLAYVTARGSESLITVDITGAAQTVTAVSMDVTPETGDTPDQLDFLAGKVYVALRQVGKLAIVDGPDVAVAELGGNLVHGVEVLDRGRPRSIIARPSSSVTLNNKRFHRIRGTSTDGASFIRFVELALKRRGRNGCRWWNGSTLVSRDCGDTLWFRAEGKGTWEYLFTRNLPDGRYVVRVRATDEAGNVERLQEVGRNKMLFRLH